MRRGRVIRRRKLYFLNAVFLASALLFYETHAGMFFKEFAGNKLQEILPGETRVEIGSISGGIFRDLTAEDVSIFTGDKNNLRLDIAQAEIDYRLWYPFLKKVPVLRRGERWASHFRIVKGKGYIDFKVNRHKDIFLASGKIHHMKFSNIDIIGECNARIDTSDKDKTRAQLILRNMILNYVPFDRKVEITLSHDRKKGILNIANFKVGSEIEGYGEVRQAPSDYIFLQWAVANLDLKEYFAAKNVNEDISGVVNGKFTLKGPMKEARFLAHFDVQNGNINDLKFDSIIANLDGKGPVISVADDSRILKENGYMGLGGTIDLSKLKEKKAFEGLTFGPGENFFAWEGWNVMQAAEKSSVVAEKYLDEDFRLSFKSYTENQEEQKKQEKHFFGVEHKVKF